MILKIFCNIQIVLVILNAIIFELNLLLPIIFRELDPKNGIETVLQNNPAEPKFA